MRWPDNWDINRSRYIINQLGLKTTYCQQFHLVEKVCWGLTRQKSVTGLSYFNKP